MPGWVMSWRWTLFDYLDWQQRPVSTAGQQIVRLGAPRGAMPATVNRRIAAVRGLFEFAVMTCGVQKSACGFELQRCSRRGCRA